jgi:hypothetical protein
MGRIHANVLIPNTISLEELDIFLQNQFESAELGNILGKSYDDNPKWTLTGYGVYFFIMLFQPKDQILLEEIGIEEIESQFGFSPQCELFIFMYGKSEDFQEALSQAVLILAEQYGGIIGVNRGIPIDYAECIGWYNSASFRNLLEENRIYFVP